MKIKHVSLLLLIGFLLLQVNAFGQLRTFHNYNHRDGLNMAAVRCVNQSEDGYLWIGTDGAELVRYNGKEFKEIVYKNADNNHHIEHISFDGQDILLASLYKGYFRYSPATDSLHRVDSKDVNLGEGLAIIRRGHYYYFIGDRGIYQSREGQPTILKALSTSDDKLVVSQIIETEDAAIILTNYGNFRLFDGALTPVHKWLKIDQKLTSTMTFGYFDGEKLTFCSNRGTEWLEVVPNEQDDFYSINPFTTSSPLVDGESIISCSLNPKAKLGGVITNRDAIYSLQNKTLKPVPHNYSGQLEQCQHIYTDLYGDYWLASSIRGLYKVSLEPFTKLELTEMYESPEIAFPYRTKDNQIIISTFRTGTFVGSIADGGSPFEPYDFTTKGAQEVKDTLYLASNLGVRAYHAEKYPDFQTVYFDNQNVTFILADGIYLWVGVAGKGLQRINTKSGYIQDMQKADFSLPSYYYAGEINFKQKEIYFGTNHGIIKYSKKDKKLSQVDIRKHKLGDYSGISTKDKFGTCWFTLEKGIVGILKSGKITVIKGDEYFKTTLFYTLVSDQLGNLIVGTNKGLVFLKVNNKGDVIQRRFYDDKSGFMGYETNMRAQFENENSIFLGTIEGLFMINTEMLENQQTPLAPMIWIDGEEGEDHAKETGVYRFAFNVNNPKAGNIRYAYRLLGENEQWILLDERIDFIDLVDLNNGTYTLEVKATFDGENFSETAHYPFIVNLPIWKTNWFILVLMASVILLNLLLMNYYKSMDSGKLMNTKDIVVHIRMTPTILLFAALTAPVAQILAPLFVTELQLNLGLSLVLGFLLIALYFMSLTAKSTNKSYLYDSYLKAALFIVTADYMFLTFDSSLHPFYLIGVILICTMVPYVMSQIKGSVIFSIVLLSIAICYVSILNETVYPKLYFLIAMIMTSSLMIFSSYLRYDSLEKLIFVSSIINKGNIPAIAFNQQGKVTYSSENISNFADITHDEFIGNNISILNQFIPYGEQYKQKDITKEFKDGEKYLVPMEDAEGTVRWIEWSYKDFSKNIKVILGQDVSEKMELENTYELLVQNAEDFIYRCDLQGNFIFLNNICYTKLGYTKEELLGTMSIDIIAEEYREEARAYYHDHFQQRKSSSYREFPICKKNGDEIWIGQYVTTLYSAGSTSHINGFIALARDITDIRKQQDIIREQRDAITSSINYARRIQYNLLPQESAFKDAFDEYFIISKPKDIVSGDFYWMHKIGSTNVLVLADCTGHGVPGSFMTLLGFNLLNSIVLENSIIDPGKILNELDKKLKEYLPKGEGDTAVNDGMEVTICMFDDQSNEMAYACAGSRFLVYEKNAFTMFKGDNKHIGDNESDFSGYSSHYANFNHDFNLFLFTDGFQDQFGGLKDKKFSFRRLLELFEANINLPLAEQRKMIQDSFERWIGKNVQTDDVTVISIKKKISE